MKVRNALVSLVAALAMVVGLGACSMGASGAQMEQVCRNPITNIIYPDTYCYGGQVGYSWLYVPYSYYYGHQGYFTSGHTVTTTIIHSSGASGALPKSGSIYRGTGTRQTVSKVSGGKTTSFKQASSSGTSVKPAKISGGSSSGYKQSKTGTSYKSGSSSKFGGSSSGFKSSGRSSSFKSGGHH